MLVFSSLLSSVCERITRFVRLLSRRCFQGLALVVAQTTKLFPAQESGMEILPPVLPVTPQQPSAVLVQIHLPFPLFGKLLFMFRRSGMASMG